MGMVVFVYCVISSSDNAMPSEVQLSVIRIRRQTIQNQDKQTTFTNWIWSDFMVINDKARSWRSHVLLGF